MITGKFVLAFGYVLLISYIISNCFKAKVNEWSNRKLWAEILLIIMAFMGIGLIFVGIIMELQ